MFNHILKSDFSRNVFTLLTGTAIAQALPILISPALTRIYTPADFGVLALFVALATIFGNVANGRYEFAIMIPRKDGDAINLFVLGLLINAIFSFCLLLLVLFFKDFFISVLENDEIGFWLYFVPVSVFFMGFFEILKHFNNRRKNYKDISRATVLKSIVLVVTQLIVGILQKGATGLISGQILAIIAANSTLLKNIFNDKALLANINNLKILALAKRYKDFPLYSVPHTLINLLFSNLPIFVLGIFFSSSVVGIYSLAMRIINLPSSLLSQAISNVLYQKLTQLSNQNKRYMNHIYKFIGVQASIALGIVVFVLLIANYMALIFGEQWAELGAYLPALLPWVVMAFVFSPLSFSPMITNQQKKAFLVEILYGAVKACSLMVGIYFGEIIVTLYVFSISNGIFIFFQGIWYIRLLKKNEAQ